MEKRLQEVLEKRFHKTLDTCTKEELFHALMEITKEATGNLKKNEGSKKLYYISAEFLIGKLLSNNLINLGLYEETEKVLKSHGHELCEIEELEMEPSLGNGGLGRLAACFLDSIATLGLPGDGIGLNYHFGLFQQKFTNHKQQEMKNPWITKESWLNRQSFTCKVPFKDFTMDGVLYDIDVPGYERIELHPATRFIATMNYGYAGTKELNEALVSRFVVIQMPMISQEHLILLLQDHYPTLKTDGARELAAVYLDLQKKCENAQISSRAMDLRGLLDGVALMEKGLDVLDALDMGITNKTFDSYEQTLIQDTIRGRISKKLKPEDLFEKNGQAADDRKNRR